MDYRGRKPACSASLSLHAQCERAASRTKKMAALGEGRATIEEDCDEVLCLSPERDFEALSEMANQFLGAGLLGPGTPAFRRVSQSGVPSGMRGCLTERSLPLSSGPSAA